MNRNLVIGIVLALLVVISAVQAFQLASIKGKLGTGPSTGGAVKTTAQTTTPTAAGGGATPPAQLPSSLENLPSMVGGC